MQRLAILILLIEAISILCLGQRIQHTYDAAGRLIRSDYGLGRTIAYEYDAAGNLKRRRMTEANGFSSISSASFLPGRVLAPEMIASGFGVGLAPRLETAGAGALPTELAGTRVELTDANGALHRAPLFFVSPGQVNFLIPAAAALGVGKLRVIPAQGGVVEGSIEVARSAPGLYSALASGAGIAAAFALVVGQDGRREQKLIYDPSTGAGIALDLSRAGEQTYLLLFGTGIRGYAREVSVTVGGEPVGVLAAVAQGQFPGLDQVNIGPLPVALAGKGEVDIVLRAGGQAANPVKVRIQ